MERNNTGFMSRKYLSASVVVVLGLLIAGYIVYKPIYKEKKKIEKICLTIAARKMIEGKNFDIGQCIDIVNRIGIDGFREVLR